MNASAVASALKNAKQFSGQTILVKLGGAALQDADLVDSICGDLALIRSVGVSVVVVHGGGPSINQELTSKGIQWEFFEGQRITTPEMMDVIEMVLFGSVNRRMVRALNAAGVPAVGLSGADASTLLCSQSDAKLGQVGKIDSVNTAYLQSILDAGIVPVIAPIGVGRKGEAYNINADWAASRVAQAMNVEKLFFLTDQDGILDQQKQLIHQLDECALEDLIQTGVVQGGMLAKVRTILHALKNGVDDVHVLNARRPQGLVEAFFTQNGVSTLCRLQLTSFSHLKNQERSHASIAN